MESFASMNAALAHAREQGRMVEVEVVASGFQPGIYRLWPDSDRVDFVKRTMEHTPACLAMQAERAAYEQFWGKTYCSVCGGTGVVSWVENQSPLGSGYYWPETMYDPCHKCMGHCPRCGVEVPEEFMETDFALCPQCGFVTGRTPGIPVVECYCNDPW